MNKRITHSSPILSHLVAFLLLFTFGACAPEGETGEGDSTAEDTALVTVPPPSEQTLYDYLASYPSLSRFKQAVDRAGLQSMLQEQGAELVLFAPNDDALQNMRDATVGSLFAEGSGPKLRTILENHLVRGPVLQDSTAVTNLQGTAVSLTWQNRRLQQVGGVPVVESGLQAANGVLHVLGGVLPSNP